MEVRKGGSMNQDKDDILALRVENDNRKLVGVYLGTDGQTEVRLPLKHRPNGLGSPLSPETGHYRSPMIDPAVRLMQALREQGTGRPAPLSGTGIGLAPLFITPLGSGY